MHAIDGFYRRTALEKCFDHLNAEIRAHMMCVC